ncbi:M64 family metallopeptidase [Bacteroides sp. 224]|uniref:M64 family metallopeptidase n=1 Tax=Bacteroides sp. 224 TaxID=2302936 RepID=UPI0013D78A98|nr:M64 family metallopeptidase [Bacteroides sp. 224]NDV65624.1 peptidase M64 [Bacteroides sp. 224]
MKKTLFIILLLSLLSPMKAQKFEDYFSNQTLRVDYTLCGNATRQEIYPDALSRLPLWAGRRHHLSELPIQGNGQITMRDAESKQCIYKTSFSTLFQEWISTDEAQTASRSFENTFLLPFPLKPVEIEITLRDIKQEVVASLTHTVQPDNILIQQKGTAHVTPHTYLLKGGNETDCINIAILAEGYTADEMAVFRRDAQIACEALFSHEPFKSEKNKFNVIAVESTSPDSGVSVPGKAIWKQTAFGSHFDTFYSDRYLTSGRVKDIHDALAGIPYEHIIILANTEEYGGGGIYNSYTLTTAHHYAFRPVVVHEFGHSFGGLADEYYYSGHTTNDFYSLEVEPWEQNITTLVDFKSKWQDMKEAKQAGLFEGGGYSAKGIYRPADNCRMNTNQHPAFCPVCQRALQRMIHFYTDKEESK